MGWVVNATPRPFYPWERPGTHCTGGWVGPRAGLDRCGNFLPPTGTRSPDRPASSESLYRLGYPDPLLKAHSHIYLPSEPRSSKWSPSFRFPHNQTSVNCYHSGVIPPAGCCTWLLSASLTFRRRIKSRLPFTGIIKSSPYSPHFQDKG
jgi:hypothetical protein